MTAPICPAQALAHCGLDGLALTPAEAFVFPHLFDLWLRPEQLWPEHDWRSILYICGRGFGKTESNAVNITREVMAGRITSLCLAAPTVERADEVQIDALIRVAPPWFKPIRKNGTIEWPDAPDVKVEVHTPFMPRSALSSNFDFAWLTELVAWNPTTRAEAFANITTATRVGRAQFVGDTTCNGRNNVIEAWLAASRQDPTGTLVIRGTTFDNPMLSRKYLRSECMKAPFGTRKHDEELLGKDFTEAAGALWTQGTIDAHRVEPSERAGLVIVAVDPAKSGRQDADESGIVVGGRRADGHAVVLDDLSGHHSPQAVAKIVVDRCERDAAGVLIEKNNIGDYVSAPIQSEARERGMTCVTLERDQAFPPRRAGVIFIREVTAATSKGERASGPATEGIHGRVHFAGEFAALEVELTTFEPGERGQPSPNRFDAFAHLITELAGLEHAEPGARARDAARQAVEANKSLKAGLVAAVRGGRRGGGGGSLGL